MEKELNIDLNQIGEIFTDENKSIVIAMEECLEVLSEQSPIGKLRELADLYLSLIILAKTNPLFPNILLPQFTTAGLVDLQCYSNYMPIFSIDECVCVIGKLLSKAYRFGWVTSHEEYSRDYTPSPLNMRLKDMIHCLTLLVSNVYGEYGIIYFLNEKELHGIFDNTNAKLLFIETMQNKYEKLKTFL